MLKSGTYLRSPILTLKSLNAKTQASFADRPHTNDFKDRVNTLQEMLSSNDTSTAVSTSQAS